MIISISRNSFVATEKGSSEAKLRNYDAELRSATPIAEGSSEAKLRINKKAAP